MASDCLPHQVLLADLFGEAADKKEVEEIATAMKEARVTKSYNSFELLASVIGFVPNINLLVPPIHQAVAAATGGSDSLKNVSIARDMLRHAALGLAVNASVELQPLCIYVRGMLLTHLPPKGGTSKLGTPKGGPPEKPGAVVGGCLKGSP
jgi:U3 small nucleolar RNA-associated protein 20